MENFKSHILVVDDDEGIRSLLKQFLNENGYLVNTASNALEAKEKISIIKFDLLFVEIDLQLGSLVLSALCLGIIIATILELIYSSSKKKNKDE